MFLTVDFLIFVSYDTVYRRRGPFQGGHCLGPERKAFPMDWDCGHQGPVCRRQAVPGHPCGLDIAGQGSAVIHAKEPGPNFREDFDRFPVLFTGLERALCPRVHFKMIILDYKMAYIGSANLTGAGIGMKGNSTRNFETGILTDDPDLVEASMNQFDSVWAGFKCKCCRRKQYCGDPILK